MFSFFIFIFSSFVFSTYQNDFSYGQLGIVTDLIPGDCYKQNLNYTEADTTDGLPKCVSWKKKPTECSKYNWYTSKFYTRSVNKPTCAKNGWFDSVQCKGERATGRCFCFDGLAKRLFGQEWWSKANDMTCACSRKKAEMQYANKFRYFNSLHCNSMGNFEPLQCDVESGQCWCADEKTGDPTSPIVPDKAMQKLPCYKSLSVGSQYLRRCESQKYAQEKILYEFKLHGTEGITFGPLLCDDDGSYGAYKIVEGSVYCTWKDNSNLGTWQSSANDRNGLNCNCARDSRIFKESGKSLTQSCAGNGNYQALQIQGDRIYCVDVDGYIKTQNNDTPKVETDCTAYPSYNFAA